ncbi:hypothetical protein T552_02386 [Pneumocystis carinii B80]|uniref:U3 small nucleolar RNA-associated protein 10 n=1 Tax=Pneumocystis carinii (strain B80) TaxID=1408658 RepID=A0A0W4ZGB0_PNEC8|nr:hypothetical protein T552_02386 [Pneumocystis carinii B80]KTW27407.1 hypothetical protein T552_02386 [Pneumocystis carinii B80]
MTTLACQLKEIHKNHLESWDKEKKISSLLFDPVEAADQDLDSVFSIANNGFIELSNIEPKFKRFSRTLFSEESKYIDRFTQTKSENDYLDSSIDAFLSILAPYFLLKPSIKVLEWLIRRFKIHKMNQNSLLLSILPYHMHPFFVKVLSIIDIPLPTWSFLLPFKNNRINPTHYIISKSLSNNEVLFSLFMEYVQSKVKEKKDYQILLKFWATCVAETIYIMRKNQENEEKIISKTLPNVLEGLLSQSSEYQIACYIVLVTISSNYSLSEKSLITALTLVSRTLNKVTINAGLICLAQLAQTREGCKPLPIPVFKSLLKIENINKEFIMVGEKYRSDKLIVGYIQCLIEDKMKNNDFSLFEELELFFSKIYFSKDEFKAIIHSLFLQIIHSKDLPVEARNYISNIVKKFKEDIQFKPILEDLTKIFKNDITEIQNILQITIEPSPPSVLENIVVEHTNIIEENTETEEFTHLINNIQNVISENLIFVDSNQQLFYKAFHIACKHPEGINILFSNSIFQDTSFKLYFLSQIWTCQNLDDINIKSSIITSLEQCRVILSNENENIDYQFFIPYLLIPLNSESLEIREATSKVIPLLIEKLRISSTEDSIICGFNNIYGKKSSKLIWLSRKDEKRFLKKILMPNIQECILDKNYICKILTEVFESNDKKDISFGRSILKFICSHIIYCPLQDVWFKLLQIINNSTEKNIHKTKILLPKLKRYQNMKMEARNKFLIIKELCKIVVEGENGLGIKLLLEIAQSDHTEFVIGACERLSELWNSIEHSIMFDICKIFIDHSQNRNNSTSLIITKMLNDIEIPEEVFISLFSSLNLKDLLSSLLTKSQKDRDSQNREIEKELQYITIFLELLEKNNPETKQQLITPLFTSLNFLITLETNTRISMAYPEQIILTCLQKITSNTSTSFDSKTIRMDLLINCICSSPTPHVHNRALLLITTIAKTAPELILHNIMPIFTFMGTNILHQDNDFSEYIIEQTIQKVIPALISNNGDKKADIVVNFSTILTSFVNAFTHIPDHRKLKLFIILIKTLGPNDFLYAFLVLLLNMKYNLEEKGKNTEAKTIASFCLSLSTSFDIEVQLLSFWKLLDFAKSLTINTLDIPDDSILIDTSEFDDDRLNSLRSQLIKIIGNVFASKHFKKLFLTIHKTISDDSNVYSSIYKIIEILIEMKEIFVVYKTLEDSLQYVLKETLILLPIKSFTITIKKMLTSKNLRLRLNACVILKDKIETESLENTNTELAAIDLLPDIIENTFKKGLELTYSALICINVIAKRYGKNNPAKFFQILENIIEVGLKNESKDLQILSCISITILSECLGPRLVPKLPSFVPYILEKLKESHDDIFEITVCSLMEALINSIPSFMLSYTKLMLEAYLYKNPTENEELIIIKNSLNNAIANKFPLKTIFSSISQSWKYIITLDKTTIIISLDLLEITIKNSKKEDIEKISLKLFNFFLEIFDMIHDNQLDTKIIITIKEKALEVFIQVIMKLNDIAFRPLFLNFRQWAFKDFYKENIEIDPKPRLLIFYKFLGIFLGRFKSIVTNYFSHIFDDTIELLKKEQEGTFSLNSDLWEAIINSIYQSLLHDTEEFWQDSIRFSKIAPALISYLSFAPRYKIEKYLIPSIAQLASVTISDEHYKTINTLILNHMNSDNTAVRLAALETQKELYTKLKGEWLATLPQTIPFISEALEDKNEKIEYSTQKLIITIESYLGEPLQRFLT